MRGKFTVDAQLCSIDATLKKREPYMILSVNTTSHNKGVGSANQPFYVVAQTYNFDEDTMKYEPGVRFDELVKCSKEALIAAVVQKPIYDVFKEAGVNYEAYQQGINVKSVDEFKADFNRFINAAAPETKFIMDKPVHGLAALNSIGCGELLSLKNEHNVILNRQKLAEEFLGNHNVKCGNEKKYGTVMQQLRDFLSKSSSGQKELDGVEAQIDLVNSMIQMRGQEMQTLPSMDEVSLAQMTNDYTEYLRQSGKIKYASGNMEEKVETLLSCGTISEEAKDRNSDCMLNHFLDVIDETDPKKKGVIFLQCGTTGEKVQKPIQIGYLCCDYKDGVFTCIDKGMFDVAADDASIVAMDNAKAKVGKKGGFDPYKYTGIDQALYKAGKSTPYGENEESFPLANAKEAEAVLNIKFGEFNADEYVIIANALGSTGADGKDHPERSFPQQAIANLGCTTPVIDREFIDIDKVIKEYCYAFGGAGLEPEGKAAKQLSLRAFSALWDKDLTNKCTVDVCDGMLTVVKHITDEYREMTKETREAKKRQEREDLEFERKLAEMGFEPDDIIDAPDISAFIPDEPDIIFDEPQNAPSRETLNTETTPTPSKMSGFEPPPTLPKPQGFSPVRGLGSKRREEREENEDDYIRRRERHDRHLDRSPERVYDPRLGREDIPREDIPRRRYYRDDESVIMHSPIERAPIRHEPVEEPRAAEQPASAPIPPQPVYPAGMPMVSSQLEVTLANISVSLSQLVMEQRASREASSPMLDGLTKSINGLTKAMGVMAQAFLEQSAAGKVSPHTIKQVENVNKQFNIPDERT